MDEIWDNQFWGFVWTTFVVFAFVAYLMVLVTILTDLFRDRALNGWYKALWIIFLIWVPFLTALVYLIGRGSSMAERNLEYAERNKRATDTYIREAAGSTPAAEIAHAKILLDEGTITRAEFDSLKGRALASH